MSVHASFDIVLSGTHSNTNELVQAFLDAGWSLHSPYLEGQTNYLPLGDEDCFDWCSSPLSSNELSELIHNKEQAHELIGLELYWQQSNHGVILLIKNKLEFSILATINRRKTEQGFTDINWYVAQLLETIQHLPSQIAFLNFVYSP